MAENRVRILMHTNGWFYVVCDEHGTLGSGLTVDQAEVIKFDIHPREHERTVIVAASEHDTTTAG